MLARAKASLDEKGTLATMLTKGKPSKESYISREEGTKTLLRQPPPKWMSAISVIH